MISDRHFAEWEASVFGFGYGTGEQYTIPAIKKFFEYIPQDGCLDYQHMEKKMTPIVFWLLMNVFCQFNFQVLDYGTSPRTAWLTDKGIMLKEYLHGKTEDELYEIATNSDLVECGSTYCNCDDGKHHGENKGCVNNPLFHSDF